MKEKGEQMMEIKVSEVKLLLKPDVFAYVHAIYSFEIACRKPFSTYAAGSCCIRCRQKDMDDQYEEIMLKIKKRLSLSL